MKQEKRIDPLISNQPMIFVRFQATWWLTLLFAYLASFLWLGGIIVEVPIVIRMAPLGLTALFTHAVPAKSDLGPPEISIHAIFWLLFFIGAFGCKKLPTSVVSTIYVLIFISLLLTLGGCAEYYNARHDLSF